MRILMITPCRFFSSYGHPIRVLGEVVALLRAGVDVTVCAYGHGQDIPGVTIQRVPYTPRHLGPGWHLARVYLSPLLGLVASSEILRRPYDVVHAHIFDGAAAGLVPKFVAGLPLVADLQDSASELMDSSGHSRFLAMIARAVERIVVRSADQILTSSSALASLLAERFRLPPDRVTPLMDAVDIDLYQPARWKAERMTTREDLGIPREAFVILYAGRLTKRQGVSTLLELMRRRRFIGHDCHFLVLGSGESRYEASVRSLAEEGGVTFLGDVPYHRIPRFLAAADVGISAKRTASEGNGKLLSYMAMELPSIASDTPTNRELLGEFGIYVSGEDPEEWTSVLASLRDSERRAFIGARLRERVLAFFSWDERAKHLIEIYERLARGSCARSERYQRLPRSDELSVSVGKPFDR